MPASIGCQGVEPSAESHLVLAHSCAIPGAPRLLLSPCTKSQPTHLMLAVRARRRLKEAKDLWLDPFYDHPDDESSRQLFDEM